MGLELRLVLWALFIMDREALSSGFDGIPIMLSLLRSE